MRSYNSKAIPISFDPNHYRVVSGVSPQNSVVLGRSVQSMVCSSEHKPFKRVFACKLRGPILLNKTTSSGCFVNPPQSDKCHNEETAAGQIPSLQYCPQRTGILSSFRRKLQPARFRHCSTAHRGQGFYPPSERNCSRPGSDTAVLAHTPTWMSFACISNNVKYSSFQPCRFPRRIRERMFAFGEHD